MKHNTIRNKTEAELAVIVSAFGLSDQDTVLLAEVLLKRLPPGTAAMVFIRSLDKDDIQMALDSAEGLAHVRFAEEGSPA